MVWHELNAGPILVNMEVGKESILDLIVGTYKLLESFQYGRARDVLRSIPVR